MSLIEVNGLEMVVDQLSRLRPSVPWVCGDFAVIPRRTTWCALHLWQTTRHVPAGGALVTMWASSYTRSLKIGPYATRLLEVGVPTHIWPVLTRGVSSLAEDATGALYSATGALYSAESQCHELLVGCLAPETSVQVGMALGLPFGLNRCRPRDVSAATVTPMGDVTGALRPAHRSDQLRL